MELFVFRYRGILIDFDHLIGFTYLISIIILMTILNGKDILDVFGYDMLAVIVFITVALLIGYVTGGKIYQNRVVSSLSAGQ